MFKTISKELWEEEVYRPYAGFLIRLISYIIDVLVFMPIVILLSGIAWLGNLNIPSEIYSGLFILYFILFHWKFGATIGKKETDLRVEKIDGKRISLVQSVLRQIIPISSFVGTIILNQFPTIKSTSEGIIIGINRPMMLLQMSFTLFVPLIFIIDALWIFTNKEKKALHDIIAKTYCKRR